MDPNFLHFDGFFYEYEGEAIDRKSRWVIFFHGYSPLKNMTEIYQHNAFVFQNQYEKVNLPYKVHPRINVIDIKNPIKKEIPGWVVATDNLIMIQLLAENTLKYGFLVINLFFATL